MLLYSIALGRVKGETSHSVDYAAGIEAAWSELALPQLAQVYREFDSAAQGASLFGRLGENMGGGCVILKTFCLPVL